MAFRCEYRRGKLVAAGAIALVCGAFLIVTGKKVAIGVVTLMAAPAFFLFAAFRKEAIDANAQRLIVRTLWGREHRILWNSISRLEHKIHRVGSGIYRAKQEVIEVAYMHPNGEHDTAYIMPQFVKLPGGVEGLLTRLEDLVNGIASSNLPGRAADPVQQAAAPQPVMPGPRRATFGKRVA